MQLLTGVYGLFLGIISIKAFTTPQDASIEKIEEFVSDATLELGISEQQWLHQFRLSTVVSFISYVAFFGMVGLQIRKREAVIVAAIAITYEAIQYVLRKRSIRRAASVMDYIQNSKWERSLVFRIGEILEICAIAILVAHLFR